MRVLGIDPGTNRMGWGVIEETRSVFTLVAYGTFETSAPTQHEKLVAVGEGYKKILEAQQPDVVAIEKLFFAKNEKTALSVAEARGVCVYLTCTAGISFVEYRPMEIKQALTGYGRADKRAVAFMVAKILGLEKLTGHDDASDALAIALTAGFAKNTLPKKR